MEIKINNERIGDVHLAVTGRQPCSACSVSLCVRTHCGIYPGQDFYLLIRCIVKRTVMQPIRGAVEISGPILFLSMPTTFAHLRTSAA